MDFQGPCSTLKNKLRRLYVRIRNYTDSCFSPEQPTISLIPRGKGVPPWAVYASGVSARGTLRKSPPFPIFRGLGPLLLHWCTPSRSGSTCCTDNNADKEFLGPFLGSDSQVSPSRPVFKDIPIWRRSLDRSNLLADLGEIYIPR